MRVRFVLFCLLIGLALSACVKEETEGRQLKQCSRCKAATYCSAAVCSVFMRCLFVCSLQWFVDSDALLVFCVLVCLQCQKVHWPAHKPHCQSPAAVSASKRQQADKEIEAKGSIAKESKTTATTGTITPAQAKLEATLSQGPPFINRFLSQAGRFGYVVFVLLLLAFVHSHACRSRSNDIRDVCARINREAAAQDWAKIREQQAKQEPKPRKKAPGVEFMFPRAQSADGADAADGRGHDDDVGQAAVIAHRDQADAVLRDHNVADSSQQS